MGQLDESILSDLKDRIAHIVVNKLSAKTFMSVHSADTKKSLKDGTREPALRQYLLTC
ncbi:MAG: hypothetical protein IH595_10655 [Bacteroidales bacterium]|nr:hypothetical protein [Bacteroidales bacterium]